MDAQLTGAMFKRLLNMLSEDEETKMDRFIEFNNRQFKNVLETIQKYKKLGNNPMMVDLGKLQLGLMTKIIQRKPKSEVLKHCQICKDAVAKLTDIYDTYCETMPSDDYVLWMNINKTYFEEINYLENEYLRCC